MSRGDKKARMTVYEALFSKKILFITGKGGVGKSTVVVHLAKAAEARGRRVHIFSLGQSGFYEDTFGVKASQLKHGVLVSNRISAQVLETYATFLEYVHLKMKIPKAILSLLNQKWLEQVFLAIPGLPASVLLGKLWHEVDGRPQDGVILVEAPPIGQVEAFFGIYRRLHELFRLGPLHSDAVSVLKMLQDETISEMVLVTLLDELPVDETLSYIKHHRDVCLRYVICNRVLFPDVLAGSPAAKSLKNHPLGTYLLGREQRNLKKLQHVALEKLLLVDHPKSATSEFLTV